MQSEKLFILGKSDATITMILDNLESLGVFSEIVIVNNLNLPVEKAIDNKKFTCSLINTLSETPAEQTCLLGLFTPGSKQKAFEGFGLPAAAFMRVIHATAAISSTTGLGYGCIINSHVSIAAHSTLGNFVSINRNASVGHHTTVEDFVTINPGAHVAGNAFIGKGAQIGMGALVLDAVKVGAGTIIGAGSVVTKDIPANVIAFGNPCKVIKERDQPASGGSAA